MKNHIFLWCILLGLISSCSNDDSITKTEREIFIETKDLIELNFIPTIENYFSKDLIGTVANRSSSLSGKWIHKFDEKGRLMMSQLFEKYPNRILKEILYSDYDIGSSKVNLEVNVFNYYTLAIHDPNFYQLNFDKSYTLKGISSNINDVNLVFLELDDNKRITLMKNQHIAGFVGYEYDSQGNIIKCIVYDEDLLVKSTFEYAYTGFGDLKSYYFQNTEGNFGWANCFYRNNNTLKRLEESFDHGSDYIGKSVFTYSNNEANLKRITDYENGRREIVLNYGEKMIQEYYTTNKKLEYVYRYRFSYNKREFYLEEHEKYDGNGELDYTKYYSEDGNVVKIVYE